MAKKARPARARSASRAKPVIEPEFEEIEVRPEELTFLNTPEFYGHSVQLFVTSTDISIAFSRQIPVTARGRVGGALMPACLVHMSPGTAKDLHLILSRQLAKFEAVWGEIETTYTRKIAAEDAGEAEEA